MNGMLQHQQTLLAGDRATPAGSPPMGAGGHTQQACPRRSSPVADPPTSGSPHRGRFARGRRPRGAGHPHLGHPRRLTPTRRGPGRRRTPPLLLRSSSLWTSRSHSFGRSLLSTDRRPDRRVLLPSESVVFERADAAAGAGRPSAAVKTHGRPDDGKAHTRLVRAQRLVLGDVLAVDISVIPRLRWQSSTKAMWRPVLTCVLRASVAMSTISR